MSFQDFLGYHLHNKYWYHLQIEIILTSWIYLVGH